LTDALHAAEGVGRSKDIEIMRLIERFGTSAVLGREQLSNRELRHMISAENVYNAWKSRDAYRDENGAENWVEWAGKHPDLSALLIGVESIDSREA
jgi:hypothetical protein